MQFDAMSDDVLLSSLHSICSDSRRIDARLILHLIEVEDRRLDLKAACSSLFDFCTSRLGFSGGAAFRRINAARLVRRFPTLLGHLESGKTHLSNLALLRDHLTEANVEALVAATAGRSKAEVERLLAERAPRPDVPSKIRKMPTKASAPSAPATPLLPLTIPSPAAPAPAPAPAPPPPARARIEPLSPDRYKVQLMASAALNEKLQRARDLMRHRNPSGDLAVVVERALDALLETLEKERLGKTSRPQRKRRPIKPGEVAREARGAVFERDGERCAYLDAKGRRCPARAFLEVDHIGSKALGGSGEAVNLRVLCRAHNRLHAEEVFGRAHVAKQIDFRQRKRDAAHVAPSPEPSTPDEAGCRHSASPRRPS